MKKINWQDLGKRALKTFIQAFIAVWAVNGTAVAAAGDFDALKTTLISTSIAAVAAGVSAVMNMTASLTKSNDDEAKGK